MSNIVTLARYFQQNKVVLDASDKSLTPELYQLIKWLWEEVFRQTTSVSIEKEMTTRES